MIRIFIADDHPIVRQGLLRLLEEQPGMTVVGEATNGRQVLLAAEQQEFDVLILDLSLPKVGGIEVLRRLRVDKPRLRVIILSMYPEDQYALRLLQEGAAAYVSKDAGPDELVRAIQQVAQGGSYLSKALATKEPLPDASKPRHASLSAREYQVFTLLFQGRTVSEIAAELNLSGSTVSSHVAHIKEKLGVHSIGEIVSYAHRAGLVDTNPEAQ